MTWNVNIYNDEKHQTVLDFLETNDIIFLTETKRHQNILSRYQFPEDFEVFINSHEPARYHGVMMIVRKSLTPINIDYPWNIPPRKDCNESSGTCGRLIAVKILDGPSDGDGIPIHSITIVGTYNPNSGSKLVNLDYRVIWDQQITTGLNALRQNSKVVWLGDLNVAPHDDDLSNPKRMITWAGCSKEERGSFYKFLSSGWLDTFRYLYPTSSVLRTGIPSPVKPDCYTWVGNGGKNYGMRLDHIIVSDDWKNYIEEVTFYYHFGQSDHTPLKCILTY